MNWPAMTAIVSDSSCYVVSTKSSPRSASSVERLDWDSLPDSGIVEPLHLQHPVRVQQAKVKKRRTRITVSIQWPGEAERVGMIDAVLLQCAKALAGRRPTAVQVATLDEYVDLQLIDRTTQ